MDPRQATGRWRLALASALLVLCSPAALATADGPDFYAVRDVAANDALNIRSQPNARAPRLGTIPPDGHCIRNLGFQGGLSLQEFTSLTPEQQKQRLRTNPRWCKVQFQGVTGWVAGRFLGESSDGGGARCGR